MRSTTNILSVFFLTFVLTVAGSQPAQAHLMVAQHGTLNFVDNGAYMVLSLPISAFTGIDDDEDGSVSMLEFNKHRADIISALRQNVTLSDNAGVRPLEGIMLSPEIPHDPADEVLSQLVVMGRYAVSGANTALQFHLGLYGKTLAEQSVEFSVTRKSDSLEQVLILTTGESTGILFPELNL